MRVCTFLCLCFFAMCGLLTTFWGSVAMLSFDKDVHLVLWLCPFVVAVGSLVLNALSKDIWEGYEGFFLDKLLWCLFMAWNVYTAFVGVCIVLHSGGYLHIRQFWSLEYCWNALSWGQLLFGLICTIVIVASPMAAHDLIWSVGYDVKAKMPEPTEGDLSNATPQQVS